MPSAPSSTTSGFVPQSHAIRSPMPDAVRDCSIYADFAQTLIANARALHVDEPFGVELKESVYALDTSTIDLCLSVFSWPPFRST